MPRTPAELMSAYEAASRAHDLDALLPLIDDCAVYYFSNESAHVGKPAVEAVIRHNFEVITGEHYAISNLHWLAESDDVAACVYDYAWSGVINGKSASGSGRGSTVLVRRGDVWKVSHEHLSRGKSRGAEDSG